MTTRFVLVHGAYHGGWCWDRLTPILRARGAEVIAPDLPGHGSDRTPSADLTLTLYADHIAGAVRQAGGPVTLVGHSMAGAVIAEVAERVPDLLTRLVYLTAYMPGPGESIIDWARRDGETRARADKVLFEDTPCLAVDRQTTWDAFYQDAPEEDLDWVFPHLRPEPVAIPDTGKVRPGATRLHFLPPGFRHYRRSAGFHVGRPVGAADLGPGLRPFALRRLPGCPGGHSHGG